ncbi:ankyrin [Amniculicola lignicola CBS 123094]|uniref:Ankyrin n=1 Tax=Amniculicola lignicola CBS 123094 TaxID=1392246 RepID=A0A6A5W547_9PLEO|nr:ankyrin [Amniculicola lignicola CBS 123094]
MTGRRLEEDAIDEVLYLARVNEPSALDTFVADLAAQTSLAKADVVAAAVDPYSKNSALHYAAANGHTDVIKLALSFTTSAAGLINTVNDSGNTPLHWAALNGHLACVKLLVQAGADVTIINKAGHDAVYEAEINDKQEVVDWLLSAVEDLEKGVGGGEGKGEGAGEDDEDVSMDTEDETIPQDEGSVDSLQKQMQGMDTHDNNSQHG